MVQQCTQPIGSKYDHTVALSTRGIPHFSYSAQRTVKYITVSGSEIRGSSLDIIQIYTGLIWRMRDVSSNNSDNDK